MFAAQKYMLVQWFSQLRMLIRSDLSAQMVGKIGMLIFGGF